MTENRRKQSNSKYKVTMPAEPLTAAEQEIVILYAVWDMISGMVNKALLNTKFLSVGEIHFTNDESKTLFSILLIDFLSRPSDSFGLPCPQQPVQRIDKTFLFYLKEVARTPSLGEDAGNLLHACESFADWLSAETVVSNLWLPTARIKTTLKVDRITVFELCGNAAKHGFSRLSGNVGIAERLLKQHGYILENGMSFQAHSELTDWLMYEGPFNYLAPVAAEHLNNVRWALYDYLKPVFRRYAYPHEEKYFRYRCPDNCNAPLVRDFYWNLMNSVISQPFFPRFTISEHIRRLF